MIGLALALGLLVPAPPAPAPAAAPPELRPVEAVVVRKDGRAVRATFTRAPEPEQLAEAGHAWLWSDSAPPVRLAADAILPSFDKVRSGTAPARLEVKAFLPGGKHGRGARVIAAPAAMWDEVPEGLLPSWVAGEGGAVTLPRSSEPYRVRAVAPGAGSAWIEVTPRARSAAVTLHPAADLRILVTDRERRELDAVLRLSDSAAQMRDSHPVAVFRAERGAVLLPSAPQAALAAVFEAEDHVPLALSGPLPDLPRQVVLEPGATVRGRFINGRKAPVAGVEVTAEWWASSTVEQVMNRRSASAADGAWTLRGVPLQTLALTVERAGFARIQRSLDPDGPVIDLGTIVLSPEAKLAVRVLGPDREPIQDAAVALSPRREARTGADGVARFAGLPKDEPLNLVVTASGYLRRADEVPAPLPAEHPVTLQKSFRVTGRYVQPEGQPVPGAALKVMAGGRDSRRELESDGSFDLDLQPELAAELVFLAPAARELRLPLEAGRAGEKRDLGEIHPLPGATVVGKVLSAVDLQPVGGARVWALRTSTLPLLAWARGDVLETRTGPDGTFSLSGGEPSPMLLRIDAAGHARSFRTVEPRAGEERTDAGEIHLTEGTTLRVLAEDEGGATARADLRGEGFDADILTAEVRDGVATLRHVPAGPVLVAVRSGGALVCEKSVDVPLDTESLDVDCTEGPPLVRGQVLVGGEPASGMLRWSRAVRQTESIILNRASPAGLPRQRVVGEAPEDVTLQTDDEGRFETTGLRPGPWSVSWLPDHGGTSPSSSITIEERGEQFVTLQFGTGAIQGLVVDDTEAPAEGAGVGIEGVESGATTGPDGTFSIDGLQPGTYRLRARTAKRSSDLVTATVDDSGRSEPVRLKLDRDATEEVVIEVAGRDGEPAAGALVVLETEDGALPLATADVSGKARFPLLPHVTRFRAAALHGGDWAFGAWAARGDRALPIGETGVLVVTAEELSGPVRLVEASGWDVTALLSRLGASKLLAPGRPADFRGLPPGSYAIAVGNSRASATVKAGETVQAKIR